jgi:hypothetical protein
MRQAAQTLQSVQNVPSPEFTQAAGPSGDLDGGGVEPVDELVTGTIWRVAVDPRLLHSVAVLLLAGCRRPLCLLARRWDSILTRDRAIAKMGRRPGRATSARIHSHRLASTGLETGANIRETGNIIIGNQFVQAEPCRRPAAALNCANVSPERSNWQLIKLAAKLIPLIKVGCGPSARPERPLGEHLVVVVVLVDVVVVVVVVATATAAGRWQ